jgi:hypothetical protein
MRSEFIVKGIIDGRDVMRIMNLINVPRVPPLFYEYDLDFLSDAIDDFQITNC